jgi:hypothetical protein
MVAAMAVKFATFGNLQPNLGLLLVAQCLAVQVSHGFEREVQAKSKALYGRLQSRLGRR